MPSIILFDDAQTVFTISEPDGTVTAVFTFNAATRRVTAPAKPLPHTVSLRRFHDTSIGLSDWVKRIRVQYPSAYTYGPSNFEIHLEKNANGVEFVSVIGGVTLQWEYTVSDGNVEISARPAVDWSWADFNLFVKSLQDFYAAIPLQQA